MIHAALPRFPVDASLVERAEAHKQGLRENYRAGDEARRLPQANIDMLQQSDLFRVLVPKRLGGHGGTMATQLAVAAELAKGCPSTAWVQSLTNITTWAMSRLPEEGQKELFGSGDMARVCGVLSAGGIARPAEGGYLVTGKWPYASACHHANWGTGGVFIQDEEGKTAGFGSACMAMSELTIEDTWKVVGMRGTGSNTLVAENVFVPHGRMINNFASPAGGKDRQTDPADHWPVGAALAIVLLGPVIGMAEAVLETVLGSVERKGFAYTAYARLIDSQVALRDIGKSTAEIGAAKLQAFNAAAALDAAGAGVDMSPVDRARLRAACGHAGDLLRAAVDRLVSVSGASSFAESSLMQRYWKDLNVASRHAFLGTEQTYEQFGRTLTGAPDIFVLV